MKTKNMIFNKRNKMRLTFVLPQGTGFSGGVRATVEMANKLIEKGYEIRLAFRRMSLFSLSFYKKLMKDILFFIKCLFKEQKRSWLDKFKGKLTYYSNLNNVKFKNNEIVIAVGMMTVEDVAQLKKKVHKIRYCHGLQEHDRELMKKAWEPDWATIVVTQKLIPKIQQFVPEKKIEVIPNGIDLSQYYIDDFERDGIGSIYNSSYIKNPQLVCDIMHALEREIPQAKRYLFGIDKKPKELNTCHYHQYPTITKARELYNRSKIWLVGSRDEGFSLPILEAMACGCVVISTANSGAVELITHGLNGFIVPDYDLNKFMHYIRLVWDNDELRSAIMYNGLQFVKQFNWDYSVNKMIKFIDKLAVTSKYN